MLAGVTMLLTAVALFGNNEPADSARSWVCSEKKVVELVVNSALAGGRPLPHLLPDPARPSLLLRVPVLPSVTVEAPRLDVSSPVILATHVILASHRDVQGQRGRHVPAAPGVLEAL